MQYLRLGTSKAIRCADCESQNCVGNSGFRQNHHSPFLLCLQEKLEAWDLRKAKAVGEGPRQGRGGAAGKQVLVAAGAGEPRRSPRHKKDLHKTFLPFLAAQGQLRNLMAFREPRSRSGL